MSQQEVIQILCDRCGRSEIRPLAAKKKQAEKESDFIAQYGGERVEFGDLCSKCHGVAAAIWARLMTTVHKVKRQEDGSTIALVHHANKG